MKNETSVSVSITGIKGHKNGWYKSAACNGGASCVEVFPFIDGVVIADSKQTAADRPTIKTSFNIWNTILEQIKENKTPTHKTEGDPDHLKATEAPDGSGTISNNETVLTYTTNEWQAFKQGIKQGDLYTGHQYTNNNTLTHA